MPDRNFHLLKALVKLRLTNWFRENYPQELDIMEQVEVKTPEFLAERESFWPHQLRAS